MKAAVLKEYGRLEWSTVPDPSISGDDTLVKVSFASICGSDQHIFRGEFHPRTKLPLIPGHEFAGKIAAVGPDVKKYRSGDRVAVDPIIWCGSCPACRVEHYPACTSLKLTGVDLDGGFAEFVKVPERMLYRIPDSISSRHAALIEVLSIGFHACNRAGLKKDDSVIIWGGGKVGQSILQAARTRTTGKIILIDILEERLQNARDHFPGIHAINAMKDKPVEVIREITKGDGADVAFEAVGHGREIPGTVNPVRGCIQGIRGAGTVCVLGLSDEPVPLIMKELIWKEARIIASRVTHGEFSETINALDKGILKPETLITDVFSPEKAQLAFELLEKEPEKHLKILLDFSV